jgi:putative tryptophan/tyrosine transport system substrate-binding protein
MSAFGGKAEMTLCGSPLSRSLLGVKRTSLLRCTCGATFVWPLAVHAQKPERVRRIGVLMFYPESDPEGQLRAKTFRRELEKLGWTIENLQMDFRWGRGNADWTRSATTQLLKPPPDVIVANGELAATIVQQGTRTVPAIFIGSGDPVADGLVQSFAHPGGNMTGFSVMEPSLGAKLLELLKEIAPRLTRVAVLFNPDNRGNQLAYASAAAAGPSFGVEVIAAPVREATEIDTAISQWGREPGHGLIVPPDRSTNSHRALIIELAARYRLPAIFALRAPAAEGGLMSYGVDLPELFRKAAIYADRILKGEKPADLPVQLPTKFELVINLRTAKALALNVPPTLLTSADEVIE